jgi:ribonuclease P protein component
MRLSGKLAFANVYDHGRAVSRFPLKLVILPNELGHLRLGLSVSRQVGTAPRRNRIKRLLRESVRLLPESRSVGYDMVVVVRPHEPMQLAAYQSLLRDLLAKGISQRRK